MFEERSSSMAIDIGDAVVLEEDDGQYAAGRSDRNVESGEHHHGVPNC